MKIAIVEPRTGQRHAKIFSDFFHCPIIKPDISEIDPSFDLIFLNEFLQVKEGYTPEILDIFLHKLKKHKSTKLLFSLVQNSNYKSWAYKPEELLSLCDFFLVHSHLNFSAKWALKTKPTIQIKHILPGFDFHSARSLHWKPIHLKIDKYRHIGRYAPFKRFEEVIKFYTHHLRDSPLIVEGLTSGFLNYYLKLLPYDFIRFNQTYDQCSSQPGFELHNNLPNLFCKETPNQNLLQRLSLTNFGFQFTSLSYLDKLPDKLLSGFKSLEHTHCEIAAVGTVPIFSKKFGDSCLSHHDKPLSSYPIDESGTIWYDHLSPQKTSDFINSLSPNDLDFLRNKAFLFYKNHQDSSVVYPMLINSLTHV